MTSKTADHGIAITVLGTVCLVIVVLISSMELLCFKGTGWYEKEYEKYSVLEDVRGAELTMDEALAVTENLQNYLTGSEPELCDFFSEREVSHLADCRDLFGMALLVRNIALVVLVTSLLWLICKKAFRPRVYWLTLAAIVAVALAAAAVCGADFINLFAKFHYLVFDNDLWLLDPRHDNLINLLPIGFFRDTVKMCVGIGGVVLVAVGLCGFSVTKRNIL
ncbi:MAG: TIGR01906 family membrane protein [Clostridiales bacterium]|nr:TIGR01906 family membrane protein [Candidatus Crickella merdequi]